MLLNFSGLNFLVIVINFCSEEKGAQAPNEHILWREGGLNENQPEQRLAPTDWFKWVFPPCSNSIDSIN
jgi:hypothetical protein